MPVLSIGLRLVQGPGSVIKVGHFMPVPRARPVTELWMPFFNGLVENLSMLMRGGVVLIVRKIGLKSDGA